MTTSPSPTVLDFYAEPAPMTSTGPYAAQIDELPADVREIVPVIQGRFGISFVDLHGLWFVAGSLVREVAALNKVEMLPWDAWGAQPPPDYKLDDEQLAYFDELAEALRDPDASFDSLRRSFASDEGHHVQSTVLNPLLDRPEEVFPG